MSYQRSWDVEMISLLYFLIFLRNIWKCFHIKGNQKQCRQPWTVRVIPSVSPPLPDRAVQEAWQGVKAANKSLCRRAGTKKESMNRASWHHSDNGAATTSPVLHLTSLTHNQKKTQSLTHSYTVTKLCYCTQGDHTNTLRICSSLRYITECKTGRTRKSFRIEWMWENGELLISC